MAMIAVDRMMLSVVIRSPYVLLVVEWWMIVADPVALSRGFCYVVGMAAEAVPAEVAIRRSRVGNIDADRLIRRRAHLIDRIYVHGGGMYGSRIGMAQRAAELVAIRDELLRRNVISSAQDAVDLAAAADLADALD